MVIAVIRHFAVATPHLGGERVASQRCGGRCSSTPAPIADISAFSGAVLFATIVPMGPLTALSLSGDDPHSEGPGGWPGLLTSARTRRAHPSLPPRLGVESKRPAVWMVSGGTSEVIPLAPELQFLLRVYPVMAVDENKDSFDEENAMSRGARVAQCPFYDTRMQVLTSA
jgi:hypothetical protein